MDPCLELVYAARNRPRWTRRQKLLGRPLFYLFMHGRTPQPRIERAVQKELGDLTARAELAIAELEGVGGQPAVTDALGALRRAKTEGGFPRTELERLLENTELDGRLREQLALWAGKHRRLERRLAWLLDPTKTRRDLARLDVIEDADQIWCSVQFEFRPEFLHSVWGNATKRIVQMESATLFLHATGRAEAMPILRAEETLCFFHYFFEWGHDSYHGRASIDGINGMHARYFIHNDALKFVLLNSAFTVLDGLAKVGHRPLEEIERLGYFNAYVKMGKAMRIEGLSHSWDEMYSWFHGCCRAWSGHSPRKLRMWRSIHDNFDRSLGVPAWLGKLRRLPELYAMDDSYLSALGARPGSAVEVATFRGLVKLLARARAALPSEPWILSLQDFHSFPNGVAVEDLGERRRSERLPATCPFSGQRLGNNGHTPLPTLSWEEVRKHDRPDDLWVVFGGYVYDVSSFASHHPGGIRILLDGVGRDLTSDFDAAGHSDFTRVFTQNFRIGKLATAPVHTRNESRSDRPRLDA